MLSGNLVRLFRDARWYIYIYISFHVLVLLVWCRRIRGSTPLGRRRSNKIELSLIFFFIFVSMDTPRARRTNCCFRERSHSLIRRQCRVLVVPAFIIGVTIVVVAQPLIDGWVLLAPTRA